jgi:hypothetical protein
VRIRFADRIRRNRIVLEPELRRRGGARTISREEALTRRDAWAARALRIAALAQARESMLSQG